MKTWIKTGLALAAVMAVNAGCNNCNTYCAKTWFSQRDQGSHQYLILPMTVEQRHQFDREESYGDLNVTLGYRQNWRRCKQAAYLFNSGNSVISGIGDGTQLNSCVNIRSADIGLSTTFSGCAHLAPKYGDFVADIDLYVGWDKYIQGLWTELRLPIIHTRWNPNLCSSVMDGGGATYCTADDDCSCMVTTNESASTDVVYNNLTNALTGNQEFGRAPALCAGKLGNCTCTTTGLGGLRLSLGYDFVRREKGSLGLGVDVAFPVWNRPSMSCCNAAAYLFEPKVGSQHMWKVGGVVDAKYLLWNRGEDRRLDFVFDGRVYGMFGGHTTRMLGLRAGGQTAFNQYLLLKQYTINGDTANLYGLQRAANLLRACVQSKAMVEAEVTAMLNYNHQGFIAAIGYNFFGRSAENLCLARCNNGCSSTNSYYVIKGLAPMYTACDPNVDGGFYSKTDSNISTLGDRIEDVTPATVRDAALDLPVSTNSCGTCSGDIDLCAAAHPRYISNTVFANFGYHWLDVSWQPFFGFIGDVEFGSGNAAFNLWGIYAKGGFCF